MRRVLTFLAGMALALAAANGCSAIVGFTESFSVDAGAVTMSVDATSPDAAEAPDAAPDATAPAGALACASTNGGGWQLDCAFGTFATAELGASRTPPSLAVATGVTGATPPLYTVGTGAGVPSMFAASVGAGGVVTPIFSDDAGDGVNLGCSGVATSVYMATIEDVTTPTTRQLVLRFFAVPDLSSMITLDVGPRTATPGLLIATFNLAASNLFVLGNVQAADDAGGVVEPSIDVATLSGTTFATFDASPFPIPQIDAEGGSEQANCGTSVQDGVWIGARGADDSGAALHVAQPSLISDVLLRFPTFFDGMVSLTNGPHAIAVGRAVTGDGLTLQLLDTADASAGAQALNVPLSSATMPSSVKVGASANTAAHSAPREGQLLIAGANASGYLTVLDFDFQGNQLPVPHPGFGDAGVLVIPLRAVLEAGAPLSTAVAVAATVGGVVQFGDEVYVSLLLGDPAAGARAVIVGISQQ
jgi:hypothetical protein